MLVLQGVVAVGRAAPVISQQQAVPPEYARALALLAEGDSTGAVEMLRAATRTDPRFGPAFLRLGSVLSALDTGDEWDFAGRLEAERALGRALALMGSEPEVLLEYGLLLMKRGIRSDALRVMENAVSLAERRGEKFSPELFATLHYSKGRIFEMGWLNGQNLWGPGDTTPDRLWRMPGSGSLMGSGVFLGGRACWPLTAVVAQDAACTGVHPAVQDRARMMEHFRNALEIDPGHVAAGLSLLSHLADEIAWDEFNALAHQLTVVAPHDPRVFLFRGIGLHHVGRSDLADSVFQLAMARMTPSEVARYADISVLLRPELRAEYVGMDSAGRGEAERIFYTIADPIYLTDVEERRVEHYSRVAWADLRFGAPGVEAPGSANDRGLIHVRYGQPDGWTQARYVRHRETVSTGSDGLARGIIRQIEHAEPFFRVSWVYRVPAEARFASDRRILPFEFQRTAGRNTANLATVRFAEDLEHELPEFYRPRTITEVSGYVHQVARFRGDEPHLGRIEVYASPPLERLGVAPGDSVQIGLFLHDREWHLAWHDKQEVAVRDSALGVSYAVNVDPGRYQYSLEARRSGPDSVPRPLARTRLSIVAEEYPRDVVSLSDLLLADQIIPRVPAVTQRSELVIVPSRTLAFWPGDPVHVYFEIYGLEPEEEGWARYRADLVVTDSDDRSPGLVERLARGAQEIFRRGVETVEDTRLTWERVVNVAGEDDRVSEFLRLELPRLPEGVYRINISVTDLTNGSTAETFRSFVVAETAV